MEIAQTIESVKKDSTADFEGLDMFLVGGAVRDFIMGKKSEDLDFVVVGSSPEEMIERGFRMIDATSFPVFLNDNGHEFALARTERSLGQGHQSFEVHFGDDVTLKEDLSRRDLTINAIAADASGKIIDPFDGQDDIQSETVRHTTQAFADDPLRVLRAARFCARFGFTPHAQTTCLCRNISHTLEFISGERVRKEMIKTFRQSNRPSKFFKLLSRFDALEIVMPEINDLRKVPAGPWKFHTEGSAFAHTMMALNKLQQNRNPTVRENLAVLAHDLGKTVTPIEQWPHHHGHAKAGIDVAQSLAERLSMSNEEFGVMIDACEQHMRFLDLPEMRESKIIRLIDNLDDSPNHISPEELLTLAEADGMGRIPNKELNRKKFENIIRKARAAVENINGRDILATRDKEPGEWVGDRLLQKRQSALKRSV